MVKYLQQRAFSLNNFLMVVFIANASFSTGDDLTRLDLRQKIESSIREPGCLSQSLARSFSRFSFWTPKVLSSGIDATCSFILEQSLKPQFVRNMVKKLAFGSDDKVFAQYDQIIGAHKSIPRDPVSYQQLKALIEAAKSERVVWADGHMSGGVYDGSLLHMSKTTDMFAKTLLSDESKALFGNDSQAQELLVDAFRYFHTSNPLHGTVFPLSVKAMREFSSMLADLVDKDHAIINSGSLEALRIGLRALKYRHQKKGRACRILARSGQKMLISETAQTLNAIVIEDHEDTQDLSFATYILNDQPLNDLYAFALTAQDLRLNIHLHLSKSAFRSLFDQIKGQEIKDTINQLPGIVSISFDTEGLVFQGISATVFADSKRRFDALESHINWEGGVYTGINSAGSLPGIDYILAYLLTLYHGKAGLSQVARMLTSEIEGPDAKIKRNPKLEAIKKHIIDMFNRGSNISNTYIVMDEAKKYFSIAGWRSFIEEILLEINLSIFEAEKSHFTGRLTSGGTESIRQAIQLYFNRFKAKKAHTRPIFLMTGTAHIAFDRHMNDLDAMIFRLNQDSLKTMNIDHLVDAIEHFGSDRIAGIIASTPNFPFGTFDDIKEISKIAVQKNIPLHIDACLGAYINQFIRNKEALFLSSIEFAGVTSWSADIHKYGQARKGLSFWAFTNEFKEFDSSLNICAPRSVSQLEMGIYSMLEIGKPGYEERAKKVIDLGRNLVIELAKINAIEILPYQEKDTPFVIPFRLKSPLRELTYTMGNLMDKLGWHLSTLGDHTLHIALTSAHTSNRNFLAKFVDDLHWVLELIENNPHMKQSSSVGIYGMAADFSSASYISGEKSKRTFLSNIVKLYADNLLSVKDSK